MFKKLLRYLTEGNTFFVLEVCEIQDKKLFCFQKIVLKKGELEIISGKTGNTLEAILPLVEKKKPLFVTLNTAQVIKKSKSTVADERPEVLVMDAFPNLKLDNFYYQLFNLQGNAVISIAKRTYVDNYIEQFKKLGVHPFSLSLGLGDMASMAEMASGDIIGSNFELNWQNDPHRIFTPLSQLRSGHFQLGGVRLQHIQVLGFAHLLRHFNPKKSISNLTQCNSRLQNEVKNTRIFDFGIKVTLGFFILLLLSNFLAFNYYHNKNQELESSLASSQLQDQSLQELKKRVTFKAERLDVLRHSKASKASWYLDELGKSIPKSITLGSIQFQPLSLPVRSDKPIALHHSSLQISGVTHDRIAFTNWSDALESQSWVNRIEIVEYHYLSNTSANFTLNLVFNATEYEE